MIKNLCIAAAVTVLFTTGSWAQEADIQADLFSQAVEVRVVNVDVHVTDKKGRPVSGLTQDDFILIEDGISTEIVYFSSSQGEAESREPATAGDGRVPTSYARAEDLVVVVYIDNYWLTPGDRKRVLDDVERFVGQYPPGRTRFMLVTHDPGIRIRAPLSTNPQPMLAALAALPEEPTQGLRGPRERAAAFDSIRAIWQTYLDSQFCAPCDCGWLQMVGVWEAYALNVGNSVQVADHGMQELLSALSGLPDRKAVLYVGSGFEQRPGLDLLQYLTELCPAYEQDLATYVFRYDESNTLLNLGAAANSSRTTIYPLDAGGIRADSSAGVGIEDPDLRPSSLISEIHRSNLQSSFQILASATGGRAILNANQPFEELVNLQSDFDNVYSLGFEPPGEADGKVHQIRVQLADKKKGMELRFRRSYIDKPLEQRLVDRAIAAMAFGAASNPLGVEASLGETETLSKDTINIPVNVSVAMNSLALVRGEDGKDTGQFRVFLAARSVDGQRTVLREKFFTVQPAGSEEGMQRVTINMRLEPDEYTIGVGVRDEIDTETSYLALTVAATPTS